MRDGLPSLEGRIDVIGDWWALELAFALLFPVVLGPQITKPVCNFTKFQGDIGSQIWKRQTRFTKKHRKNYFTVFISSAPILNLYLTKMLSLDLPENCAWLSEYANYPVSHSLLSGFVKRVEAQPPIKLSLYLENHEVSGRHQQLSLASMFAFCLPGPFSFTVSQELFMLQVRLSTVFSQRTRYREKFTISSSNRLALG